MYTEGLILYHGTTASSARQIITGRTRDLSSAMDLRSAAKIIVGRIEAAAISFASVFRDAGCKLPTTAPIALKNLADGNSGSLFSYGPFFATLDPRSAYNYALRGGSEALQCLRDGIAVTEWLGKSVLSELLDACPHVVKAIDALSNWHPVIICLRGVSAGRLTREAGEDVTTSWLNLMAELIAEPGYSAPATVRISDVKSSDVFAVHDLGDHKAVANRVPYFDEGWSLPPSIAPSQWLTL